jgi:hypothetical protein
MAELDSHPPQLGDDCWPSLDSPNELVQRLRSLRWPAPSPEVRRRCWMRLAPRFDALFDRD